MRADFLQNFGALIDRVKFARDSPLEGVGFESSVPHEKQPFLAAPVRSPQFAFGNKNRLFRARDRWFESISLQRRVSEPSVPPNKFLRGFRHDRSPDPDGLRRCA